MWKKVKGERKFRVPETGFSPVRKCRRQIIFSCPTGEPFPIFGGGVPTFKPYEKQSHIPSQKWLNARHLLPQISRKLCLAFNLGLAKHRYLPRSLKFNLGLAHDPSLFHRFLNYSTNYQMQCKCLPFIPLSTRTPFSCL